MVRVRFAPSPTGYLHVGGARTALYNWLFARHHGGQFILRIEDTDRTRFVEDAVEDIQEGLRWLGLTWDEGPVFQSTRLSIYREHVERLVAEGKAYPCFCSPQRLEALREEQRRAGKRPGYDRKCRFLSPEEREERIRAGEPHTVRLAVPLEGETRVVDALRGEIVFDNRELEDIILLKSDGYPTYHLANVVDDHLMGITHVMRADEWIPSLPYHVLLYQAFGWDPPVFAHLPVILSPDGKGKLSKRHGATSVREFQRMGYLPEALRNYLALLGWSPGDDREILSVDEMIRLFDLDRVRTAPARFDYQKLLWMNSVYIQQMDEEELVRRVRPFIEEEGLSGREEDVRAMVRLLRDRVKTLREFVTFGRYFFEDPTAYDPDGEKKHFKDPRAVAERLRMLLSRWEDLERFDAETLERTLRTLAEELGVKAGALIHPVRLAVTGFRVGPSLFILLEALGRDRVLRRIRRAIAYLEEKVAHEL